MNTSLSIYYYQVKSFFQKKQTLHNFWALRLTLTFTISEYNSSPEEVIKHLEITKNTLLSVFGWESCSIKKKFQRAVGRYINFFSERNLKQFLTQCDMLLF